MDFYPFCFAGSRKSEEGEVKWDAAATSAERIREQTQLSLTERLRKEFGLDTLEAEEDYDIIGQWSLSHLR